MMIQLTILGEPASKANSRRLVWRHGKPAYIKSQKALDYERSAKRQLAAMQLTPLEGDVAIGIVIYYRTNRPDLDESLILDVLQGFAYKNDRQVREKHIRHFIDKDNPRAEMIIKPRQSLDEIIAEDQELKRRAMWALLVADCSMR
jgi:Holliday junction resolvase RusA-like endonuclease